MMRITHKYKIQILSYFWGYDQTNIYYSEISKVKIEITNTTSFHGFEMQFHNNIDSMWLNFKKGIHEGSI